MQIFFVLGGRLGALETKLPSLLVTRPHPVVLLCQRVVLGLCLLRRSLCFHDSLLRAQTGLLPLLTPPFDIRCEFVQVVGHLLERHGKLQTMVGHPIVEPVELINATAVGALTVLGAMRSVVERAGQLPQALGMFFLLRRSLLQERREILSVVSVYKTVLGYGKR